MFSEKANETAKDKHSHKGDDCYCCDYDRSFWNSRGRISNAFIGYPHCVSWCISIPSTKGETLPHIGARLQEEHFSSSWAFYGTQTIGYCWKYPSRNVLSFQGSLYSGSCWNVDQSNPSRNFITIPEGFTNADIDARLEGILTCSRRRFLECIQIVTFQNFLFSPPILNSAKDFLSRYVFCQSWKFFGRSFCETTVANLWRQNKTIFGTSERNGWDILKMASIIEKNREMMKSAPSFPEFFGNDLIMIGF